MDYCMHCINAIESNATVCPHCGKPPRADVPAHHLLPGTVLNRKFYVGAALGEGGFGITYIGRDLTLDMKVAIKEYFPSGYVNRTATLSSEITTALNEERKAFFEKGRGRFLEEARILARFSSEPGVVAVRDFFEENNTAYIIMEYLEGQDLKAYVKQHGTLSADETIRLLTPVMHALVKIHAHGLIHRDISPDNIRLTPNGVKLLDFGAARSVTAIANKSLSVMLKPGYAPEEQYRSKGNQGPWTDVYALCATMYKCITGVTPDDSPERLFNDTLKTPSALGFTMDPTIEHALMKGLSVLQRDRYASVEELMNGFCGSADKDNDSVTVHIENTVGTAHETDEATVYVDNTANETDEATVYVDSTVNETDEATVYVDSTVNETDEATVYVDNTAHETDEATVYVDNTANETDEATVYVDNAESEADAVASDGNSMETDAQTDAAAETPPKKKKRPFALIVGGLAAAILIVVLIASLGNRGEKFPFTTPDLTGTPRPLAYTLSELGTIADPDRTLSFADNFLCQYTESGMQYLNHLGELASDKIFSTVQYLGAGLYATCSSAESETRWGLMRYDGTELLPCEATAIDKPYTPYNEAIPYLLVTTLNEDNTHCTRVFDTARSQFVGDIQIMSDQSYSFYVVGSHFLITDSLGTTYLFNENGEVLFQTTRHVSVNGSIFMVNDGGTHRIYDENGTQTYVSNHYIGMVDGMGGYLYRIDGDQSVVMDRTGNVLPGVSGEVIHHEADGVFRISTGDHHVLIRADGTRLTPDNRYESIFPIAHGYYSACLGSNSDGNLVYSLLGHEGVVAEGLPGGLETLTILQNDQAFLIGPREFGLSLSGGDVLRLDYALIAAPTEATGLYGVYDLFSGSTLLDASYETVIAFDHFLYTYKNGAWTVFALQGPAAE